MRVGCRPIQRDQIAGTKIIEGNEAEKSRF
jgi:hypothetical protein